RVRLDRGPTAVTEQGGRGGPRVRTEPVLAALVRAEGGRERAVPRIGRVQRDLAGHGQAEQGRYARRDDRIHDRGQPPPVQQVEQGGGRDQVRDARAVQHGGEVGDVGQDGGGRHRPPGRQIGVVVHQRPPLPVRVRQP